MANGRSGSSGGSAVFRVVEDLRARMAGGALPLGSPLPPQRELARSYDVSRDTVQKALQQLREEGWVESRQGSGTRVIKTQQVQSYTAKAAREGRVTLREFFDEAFAREEVALDVFTLTSESLDTQVRGQIERIRSGETPPRGISVRMLLPSESLDLPYPRALDDPGGRLTARLQKRLLGITHRHSSSLEAQFRQLEAEGMVGSARIEVRHVDLAPAFKLYLINGVQALHGPYEVIERPIVLSDKETVEALDVLGLGAMLTHYLKDDNPDSRGSVFMAAWQAWFDSVWTGLAY
ncbi:winged helix-turn-helix domain-containing protein [Streptomyces sp. NPDC016845]|uniref:winged helix-turn-helix domain-containing protein n=1 Tax=Streptomyces sp. NPDC016845 TaxID=3364972 RepID=UPI0037890EA6